MNCTIGEALEEIAFMFEMKIFQIDGEKKWS